MTARTQALGFRAAQLRGALLIAAVVVVVDQLTKAWAVEALADGNIDLIGSLRLNLAFNTGMAFSKGTGIGPVIGVVALLVVVGLLISVGRSTSRVYTPAVGLIIGGAIGNLLDRMFRSPGWFRGGVVDFIDFQWWPIFNVADMGVTVGGTLLLLSTLRAPRPGDRSPEPVVGRDLDARDEPDGGDRLAGAVDSQPGGAPIGEPVADSGDET